jgi:hypothetical protein
VYVNGIVPVLDGFYVFALIDSTNIKNVLDIAVRAVLGIGINHIDSYIRSGGGTVLVIGFIPVSIYTFRISYE